MAGVDTDTTLILFSLSSLFHVQETITELLSISLHGSGLISEAEMACHNRLFGFIIALIVESITGPDMAQRRREYRLFTTTFILESRCVVS